MLYRIVYITSFILFLLVFLSCQEITTEPNTKVESANSILKDGQKIPTIHAYGIVYDGQYRAKYATVQLLDMYDNILNETTADGNGEYEIVICFYGEGRRLLKAIYNGDDGGVYFDYYYYPGIEDFNINIEIGIYTTYNYK